MIEIIWEYVVKEEFRGQFELAYGPGGAWSQLFAGDPGYRGTTVLRDMKNPRRFLTVDLWDTETNWEKALSDHMTEYADLQDIFEEWTELRTELGNFRILAEATVRPRGKEMRSKARGIRRRTNRRT